LKHIIVVFIIFSSLIFAQTSELMPISKTKFFFTNKDGMSRTVDMKGKAFILISVREKGSDGRFYAVDEDGTVWLSSAVTSGIDMFTPSGIFKVLRKHRYHMSSAYPDEDGINNMDYSLFFTPRGHAIHQGSMTGMSHGCIHVHKKVVPSLFNWAWIGMPVLTTRHSYMNYAQSDLKRIYRKVKKIKRRADHSRNTFKR